ncbi:GDSL esterase/lipase At1g71250-like [Amaranthus tricolor]|uniref:GDSL esterase/lipase At1g71250-like n=1 Tax=Amaranthus tricolor TaxID=29722 RepID=UPI002590B4EB|nr:GDSL esterase/lipase At1g71250-like [Amaranthus tricolor]
MISFPSSYLFCIRLPIKSSHLVIIFQFISWCCHKMENIPTLLLLMLLHFGFSNAKIGSHEVIDNPSPVSAMFAFGDMMIETGNNNFLNSIAKSNFWPYGCDFNRGPTGRFTNGKTIVDLLGERFAMPYLPPYADPTTAGPRIMAGVNYASAGAGILDETARHWGDRFSLSQQVINFQNTLNQLRNTMSGRNITRYLEKSIAFMWFGTNDYINNYLMPLLYDSSFNYKPPEFANLLLTRYAQEILALYNVGLRKFFIVGLSPIGCIPNQRATGQAPVGRCVDSVNQMLGSFNEGLRSMVVQLNANHPAGIFVYFNAYGALGDILNNPASYGFTVIDRACCGLGQITCLPSSMPCPSRNQYLFWDAYQTTEAANSILAQRAFTGPPADCYPINFQQLALI